MKLGELILVEFVFQILLSSFSDFHSKLVCMQIGLERTEETWQLVRSHLIVIMRPHLKEIELTDATVY